MKHCFLTYFNKQFSYKQTNPMFVKVMGLLWNHFSFSFFPFIFIVDTITNVPISTSLRPSPASTPAHLWPSPHCLLCPRALHVCPLAFLHLRSPSPSLPQPLWQPPVCPMRPHLCSILFPSSFCSLDSTSKCDQRVCLSLTGLVHLA